MASGRIGRLSKAVASQLRSHTVVASFEQAVEELVCNSLDAGATLVRVQFDGGGACVKVEDDGEDRQMHQYSALDSVIRNGHGMSRDDLELVGLRHATSKLRTLEELEAGISTLGFRGEALSSLADISILEITSRVQGCPHTYCKIMQGSSAISLKISSQQRARGTSVAVRDMFYNQPVRRRLFQSNSRKLLQSVKERIVRMALAHSDVSFILTDMMRGEEALHIGRHTTMYGTLRDVFGCEFSQGLKEVDFVKGGLRLSGFLSRSPTCTSSKATQYLYINNRFVHKTPLHKVLNRWGKSNGDVCGAEQKTLEKLATSSNRKAYPAFVLSLSCPLSEYDITFEATKTYVEFKDWTPVHKFLENVLGASWGGGNGKREQELQMGGKKRSWCASNCVRESSFETKLKSKRARAQTVDHEISVVPEQADSVSVPQLGCISFRSNNTLALGEYNGERDEVRYLIRGDIEIETSTWGELARPGPVEEDVGWLDTEISTPPHTEIQNKHSSPAFSSPELLCLSSPHISMPSSPVLSEGSWDDRFNACHGADDFAIEEVSSANTNCGALQPPFQSMDSEISDIFQGMNVPPLRTREPWISPDRSSDSMISLLGETSNRRLSTTASPMNMLLLPSNSWSELNMEGPNGEDLATESHSDVEEVHFRRDLDRWSDRLEKPLRPADDYAAEPCQELISSGEYRLDCTTNRLTGVAEGQEIDRMKVISLDELDNAIRAQSGSQEEWSIRPFEEASEHECSLSKFRSSDEGNFHPNEDLAPVASLYKGWTNPCMRANVNDNILDVSAGVLASCNKFLQPNMVTKESLQKARALQQVDNKFIPIVAQNVLLLVDQHAADERIRLEELRAEVLAAGKKQCSTMLSAKHNMALGLGEQQTLHAYRKQIEDWGWHVQPVSDAQGFNRTSVRNNATCNLQLTAVPSILGVNLTANDLQEYLQQLEATQGASVPPPAVIRVLNYKSCRGAIMFGDRLLPSECGQILSHLKRTSLCFQCAHGRPTMVPLVDLRNLRRQFEPPTSTGPQADAGVSWHKLTKRPASLVRARERLHQ